MKISIIVPVYNEEKTLAKILDKLVSVDLNLKKEILIIDDGSKDNTKKVALDYIKKKKQKNIEFKFYLKKNGGKGSAVRQGIKLATGDIITIQDADLEYNPEDYKLLITPIINGTASVVYGSRILNKNNEIGYFVYYLGNKFLTLLTKLLYFSGITDMETCYKVFRADIIKSIPLKSNKFDIEPEITAKILRKGVKIKEIPISYSPRTIEEGKKINWKDGLHAILVLLKWRFAKWN